MGEEFRRIVASKLKRIGRDNRWAANRVNISYAAWCRRMRGDCPFKENEISIIVKLLKFTDDDILDAFGGVA